MITSLRRNWVAWLIMKPRPALALICSATTSASQATPRLCRRPTRICGSAPGRTICGMQLAPAQVQDLAELAELGVHVANAGERVQVQRDRGADGDQQDLGRLRRCRTRR